MRNFLVFTLKELREGVYAYKGIILLTVFLLFGVMNPLFAKLTPELIGLLADDGIAITLPDPVAIDSWMQFFKNITQMGLIVITILFSGIIAQELNKGTLITMLTKGLSRSSVILAKFTALLIMWTLAYSLCLLVTAGYTAYLFPDSGVENLGFALFALWLFGVLLLSLLILAASISKSNYACLLMVGAGVVFMLALGIVPAVHDSNPLSLASDSNALMSGALAPGELVPALVVALAASIVSLVLAVLIFRKRQI